MIERIQIVHKDFEESLKQMSYESVGRLFMALLAYANEEDPNVVLECDQIAGMFFPTLKAHIDRQENYRKVKAESGRLGGKNGGAPIGNSNASKTKQNKAKQSKTKQNKPPSPCPSPCPSPNPFIKEILSFLNEKTGRHFRESKETERLINGRLSEGYTVDDFKTVIVKKCKAWKNDPKMCEFLRPSTLFAPSHFEEYLNAPEGVVVSFSGENAKNQFNRFTQRQDDFDYDSLVKN